MRLIPWSDAGIDAVHRAIDTTQRADGVPSVLSRDEVAEWWDEPHFDPATDGVLAIDGGEVVGHGLATHSPSGQRLERVHIRGATLPDHRGRGIGSELLAWQLARGREQLADYDLPSFIRTWEYDFLTGSHRLYEDHGLTPIRWFEELIRPVGPIDARPDVDVVGWDEVPTEAIHAVKNAAFADHWGSTDTDRDEWDAWLEMASTRTDLSFVAVDDGAVVGFSLNSHHPQDEELTGRLDGWIDSLGVVGSHRKRGIASALIARSVAAFEAAGFTHAMLGVDSDNPTGARGLYARLGFEPIHRAVMHEVVVR